MACAQGAGTERASNSVPSIRSTPPVDPPYRKNPSLPDSIHDDSLLFLSALHSNTVILRSPLPNKLGVARASKNSPSSSSSSSSLSWTGVEDEPIPLDDDAVMNETGSGVLETAVKKLSLEQENPIYGQWEHSDNNTGSDEQKEVANNSLSPAEPTLLRHSSLINREDHAFSPPSSPLLDAFPPPSPPAHCNSKQESILIEDTDSSNSSTVTVDSPPSKPCSPLPESFFSASFPNDQSTLPFYRFQNYGAKYIGSTKPADDDNTAAMPRQKEKRKYFKCSDKGCFARYFVTSSLTSNNKSATKVYTFISTHNHSAPPSPRIRPEVKERALAQMSAGATPAIVHSLIVRNAPLPLSSADVPTIATLKNWKHVFSLQDMPSGDVFFNITTKHPLFVRECKVHPTIHIAMASEFGIDLLNKSHYVIVDGTFDTTECKVVLTTILGFHKDIAVPCAYLLSNSKEADNYEAFYRVVKKATKEKMAPRGVLLDFEEALSESFVRVFPNASILADFFHMVQANVKKIGQLGFKTLCKDVVTGVQSLWYAPTKVKFDGAVAKFVEEWDKKVPAYATYFRRNWLERFHPEKWASYARADDAPSGSGSAEGYHRRLDTIMPRAALPLDKMVDFLVEEDEYWKRLIENPRLLAERKTRHASVQEKHRQKRRLLKHYVERGANPERAAVDNVNLSSNLFSDTDEEEGKEEDEGDGSIVDLTNTTSTHSSPPPAQSPSPLIAPPHGQPAPAPARTRKPRGPGANIPPEERCPKCKGYKLNTLCSLVVCKTCCAASTDYCKLPDHRRSKVGARHPTSASASTSTAAPSSLPAQPEIPEGIKERVEAAINTHKDIYISYQKGSNGSRPRRINPSTLGSGKEGILIHAYCHVAKNKRSFYMHLISRVEDHDWEAQPQGGASASSHNTPTAPPAPFSQGAPPTTLPQWLKENGLECYSTLLEENGFSTLPSFAVLDQSVLDTLGITRLAHRLLLLRKAREYG